MSLPAGAHLGPYEIVSPLGAGAMGEVYRARDTRLGRTVAIKVLRAPLAGDPARRERFQREAKAISRLNHPNICTLYDVGDATNPRPADPSPDSGLTSPERIEFLVMEYVEGQTLAARLQKGALPLDQALQLAVQIAEALSTAHRGGIVHRDLKPGNIMLTRAGAKLLDFGIARIRETDSGPVGAVVRSNSGMVDGLTAHGVAVGTPPYMAPEQLIGLEADARSDVFAFGALVYEMVTGRRAFEGDDPSDVMVAVLESEPPAMADRQPLTPPLLDYVVRRCLAKNPEDRWSTAHDLAILLTGIADAGPAVAATPRRRRRSRRPVAVALAGIVVLAAAAAAYVWPSSPAPSDTRTAFVVPSLPGARFGDMAMAPDGRSVGYVSEGALWVRSFDSLAARRLPDTEGAYGPFWAPDSRTIAFFVREQLKRVDVSGSDPQVIAAARRASGGTWSDNGVIIFAANLGAQLYRVPAAGGEPTILRTPDRANGQTAFLWPHFLPGGERFLYLAVSDTAGTRGLHVASLTSDAPRRLLDVQSNVVYASGHLLFVRRGALVAQPFDLERLTVTGTPASLAERVDGVPLGATYYHFAAARNEALVYRGGRSPNWQLAWFDRKGQQSGSLTPPGEFRDFAISPSGTRVAVDEVTPETGLHNIWVFDLERNARLRLTPETADHAGPVWSPDGTRIAYLSNRDGRLAVYERPADGTGQDRLLLSGMAWPTGWSTDGTVLAVEEVNQQTGADLMLVPLAANRPRSTFLQTPSMEREPQISPNGRWMAYSSSATGPRQVYVDSIPPSGRPWQVSSSFGMEPRWRRDGKELFYISEGYVLTAVAVVSDGKTFRTGRQEPLFEIGVSGTDVRYHYDVAPDGKRFLVNRLVQTTSTPLTVVMNWPSGLTN